MKIEDVSHTMKMVLNDNQGQALTEALIIGIEQSVLFYLRALPDAAPTDVKE